MRKVGNSRYCPGHRTAYAPPQLSTDVATLPQAACATMVFSGSWNISVRPMPLTTVRKQLARATRRSSGVQMITLRYAAGSDVGRVRQGNEDAAYAGARLLAVADGMGGHVGGE